MVEPYQPKPEPSLSEQLRKIDWFQFEKLVELIYPHRGYSVMRSGGANPDGGVDLIVCRDNERSLGAMQAVAEMESGLEGYAGIF